MFEDSKGIARSRKSKDRQYNDLQNTTPKTKYRPIWIPQKSRGGIRWSRMVRSSFSSSGTRPLNLVKIQMASHEGGRDGVIITSNVAYPCSLLTQIFRND